MLTIILFIIAGVSYSQDTVRIKHTNYTTVFSKSKYYPVLVEWYVTKAKVSCANQLARKDQFAPDPLLKAETDIVKDYIGSGTDRGHMCPAAENQCQGETVQAECFYMSNMAAQYHSLNAGDWKALEVVERAVALQKDSVHVWAGSIGVAKRIGKVAVPKQCWKVIYIFKDKEYLAYVFDNTPNKPTGLLSHEVTLDYVERLTGFKFK